MLFLMSTVSYVSIFLISLSRSALFNCIKQVQQLFLFHILYVYIHGTRRVAKLVFLYII